MVRQTEALPEIMPDKRTAFEKWVESEGLDLLGGFYVEDLRTLPLKPWARKGGLGVYIKLEGAGGNAAYVCEISPGGTLEAQRHLFEENIYILKGEGATKVWNDSGGEQALKWKEGSLFAIPLNAWHQHFNTSGKQVVRYVAVTLAPYMMNIFRNTDFIFNIPFDFKERFNGEEGYFSGKEKLYRGSEEFTAPIVETNFVYDLPNYGLREWKERGTGGTTFFEMAGNNMTCHVSEFPVGTYKKTHRHGPGAHIVIIEGKGYSLMWPEESPIQRFDWHEGSMIAPPNRWWHQHSNIGNTPVRYLALHDMTSRKFKTGMNIWAVDKSVKEGGDQIEHEDEMPEIREMFEKELAKSGIKCQMPRYTKEG